MSRKLSSAEEARRTSPTLDMDGIEQAVALARCLIGSIDLDLSLDVVSDVQSRFGDSKETPWLRFDLGDGASWFSRVDELGGRSQLDQPPSEVQSAIPEKGALRATHAYMKMLAAQAAGLLAPREATYEEAERLRASALTLSGVEGVAHEILNEFPTDGSSASTEPLIPAIKTLYPAFAMNSRQAAYLLAGSALLNLWPQELVRNASLSKPPGNGPHRMRQEIAQVLRSPFTPGTALASEPLAFAVAPLLLDANSAEHVVDLIDTLMDDVAERINVATRTSQSINEYQERVFFAIPAALASMMISNAFRGSCKLPGVHVPVALTQRDNQRHEVNTERWVRMQDALVFQAADVISQGRAWASLKLQVQGRCQEQGEKGARAQAQQFVSLRILPKALSNRLLCENSD